MIDWATIDTKENLYVIPSDVIDKDTFVLLNHDESLSSPVHAHEFYEVEYILRGTTEQVINNEKIVGNKGDIFFFIPGDTHSFDKSSDYDAINCLFHPELLKAFSAFNGEFNAANIQKKISLSYFKMADFESALHCMEKELHIKGVNYRNTVKSLAFLILNYILKFDTEYRTEIDPKTKLDILLAYIDENYASVTPKELAEKFFYNQNYLCKIFKENTAMTMTNYINRIRINHALHAICTTSIPIEQIAFNVGIPDKKNFYKLFKAQCGLTPSSFRKHKSGESKEEE